MLTTGMTAPDFELENQDGKPVRLSDFRGKKVVLYFYPKDNTPGCTVQAQTYKEKLPEIQDRNAVVIGVSKDTVSSHKKFEEKYGLPFILLADPERKVLDAYGVQKEKTMFGKKVMGTVRTTFLIDENGVIQDVREKVKPAEDPTDVLALLEK